MNNGAMPSNYIKPKTWIASCNMASPPPISLLRSLPHLSALPLQPPHALLLPLNHHKINKLEWISDETGEQSSISKLTETTRKKVGHLKKQQCNKQKL
jgi:hypothetical protein